MNITRNNIDDLNALLQLEITPQDYLPQVQASLKKIRKEAKMNGFRPGMVPIGLIKNRFGEAVMVEEIEKMVGKGLQDYIVEEDLRILFRPIVIPQKNMEFSVQEPTNFIFDYEIALEPEFDLNYKSETVKKYAIEMSDDFINEELDRLRIRFGKENEAEPPLEDKDILNIRLEELKEDGLLKEDGASNESIIAVDLIKDADIKAEVLKLELEGHININLKKAFDRKEEDLLKFLLDKKEEEAEGLGMDYRLTLLSVKRIEIAEMNPVFFEQVYRDKTIDTEEKFMERFRQDFEELKETRSNEQFKLDIYKHLIETVQMDLPVEFIEKFINQNAEEAVTNKQIEDYLKSIKWDLIKNKIATENDVEVERTDLETHAMWDMKRSYQQYIQRELSDEEARAFSVDMLKDNEYVADAHGKILENKLFDLLTEQVNSEPQSISYEDFNKLN